MKYGFLFIFLAQITGSIAFADNYIVSNISDEDFTIVEICYVAAQGQGTSEGICRSLVGETHFLDLKAQVIRGNTVDGESLTIPLELVKTAKVARGPSGVSAPVSLHFDALVNNGTWPPVGRIKRVALRKGQTVVFDIISPGLDLEKKVLFWFSAGAQRVEIPFADIFYLQIRKNRFIEDFNSLAKFGVIDGLDLKSGERIDLQSRVADLVDGRRVVVASEPPVEYELEDVRTIRVGDVRLRQNWPPAIKVIAAVDSMETTPTRDGDEDGFASGSSGFFETDETLSSQKDSQKKERIKSVRLPSGAWTHVRNGLNFGFNIGVGNASDFIEGRNQGIGLGLRIGVGLSNQFLVGLDAGWFHGTGGEEANLYVYALNLTLTWHPRAQGWFLKGGVGKGRQERVYDASSATGENGSSYGFGAGHEWRLKQSFALGVSLDYNKVNLDKENLNHNQYDFTNLTAKFTWYY